MFNSKYVQLDSTKKTIVFWVNASFAIGGGHIARCLALADYANSQDFQSIIITTECETSKHLSDGIPYILMSNNIKDVSKTLKHLMLKFNIRCLISDFNYHTNKNAKLKYHKYLDTVKKIWYLFIFF